MIAKVSFHFAIVYSVVLLATTSCSAMDGPHEDFERHFFEPIEIAAFSIDSHRLAALTPDDMREAESAKVVLGAFFKSLEDVNSGNPLKCMTVDFSREFPDRLAVRKHLVADETTVLEVRLTNFSRTIGSDEIQIDFSVTVFSEGTFQVGEGVATLRRVTQNWKIANIVIKE